MSRTRSEREVHAFYRLWASRIFDFCRLFHGDPARAEEATAEAFVNYVRRGLALDLNRLPDLLLRSAVEAAKRRCFPRNRKALAGGEVGSAILSLPCDQRAVFILRDVLEMDEETTAVATELPRQQVCELRRQSLLGVRELVSKDFCEEHTR